MKSPGSTSSRGPSKEGRRHKKSFNDNNPLLNQLDGLAISNACPPTWQRTQLQRWRERSDSCDCPPASTHMWGPTHMPPHTHTNWGISKRICKIFYISSHQFLTVAGSHTSPAHPSWPGPAQHQDTFFPLSIPRPASHFSSSLSFNGKCGSPDGGTCSLKTRDYNLLSCNPTLDVDITFGRFVSSLLSLATNSLSRACASLVFLILSILAPPKVSGLFSLNVSTSKARFPITPFQSRWEDMTRPRIRDHKG